MSMIDVELLKKYNKSGPRYTSYPTAPHFHTGFDDTQYRDAVLRSCLESPDGNISLYFHFPFCKSLCYFCACNVIVTHNESRIDRYLSFLKREIEMVSDLVGRHRQVTQMHWGGGTPTYLSPAQMDDINGFIRRHFNFHGDAEVSIEIDPRRLTPEHLPTLRRIGFNRVSFGIQDVDEKVQETINRVQSDDQNTYVIRESRHLNFDSINVDLIYGLPYQTLESYQATLDNIIDLDPDRLAVFNYAHVPWLKKHQELLPEDAMPSSSERLAILELINERLTEAGYVAIGMDHFAKPDDELTLALNNHTLYRNFQGYSTRSDAEVFAMGVTAISQLDRAYAQNVKTMKEYEERINDGRLPTMAGIDLTLDDRIRRFVITELMCNNRVLKTEVAEKFGVDFDSYFAGFEASMEPFLLDGLVELKSDRISVNDSGRMIIRNIAMCFDAYLEKADTDKKPMFSRTV